MGKGTNTRSDPFLMAIKLTNLSFCSYCRMGISENLDFRRLARQTALGLRVGHDLRSSNTPSICGSRKQFSCQPTESRGF